MPIRLGLSQRSFWQFVTFATVLIAAVGWLSYQHSSRTLRAAVEIELQSQAIDKEARIGAWIAAQTAEIEAIASAAALQQSAPRAAELGSARAIVVAELAARGRLESRRIRTLALADPDSGRILAATDSRLLGAALADRRYWQRARQSSVVLAAWHPQLSQQPVLALATPLRASDGRVLGVLVAWLDLDALAAIIDQRSGLRSSDESYLVDADGRFLSQPRLRPSHRDAGATSGAK